MRPTPEGNIASSIGLNCAVRYFDEEEKRGFHTFGVGNRKELHQSHGFLVKLPFSLSWSMNIELKAFTVEISHAIFWKRSSIPSD